MRYSHFLSFKYIFLQSFFSPSRGARVIGDLFFGFFLPNRDSSGRKLLPFVLKLCIVTEKNLWFSPQVSAAISCTPILSVCDAHTFSAFRRLTEKFLDFSIVAKCMKWRGLRWSNMKRKKSHPPPKLVWHLGTWGRRDFDHIFSSSSFYTSHSIEGFVINSVFILWRDVYIFPNTDVKTQSGHLTLSPVSLTLFAFFHHL